MTAGYDVAVVGGGPVGCVTALAYARQGASVLVLEANPRSSERLAGEWLHPPAIDILTSLQVPLDGLGGPHGAHGFAVFPDDGSEHVVLPYGQGEGMSFEHAALVARLRQLCARHGNIRYENHARVSKVEGQMLTINSANKELAAVEATLVVGAAGRVSSIHQALDNRPQAATYSRMAGLLLHDVTLPCEGYGHVFLGGPGPILAYRLADNVVRLCIDVPLDIRLGQRREATLWDGYRAVLPTSMRPAFLRALRGGARQWASNQTRPRAVFGREGLALVGDSVGYHHPLTALGMTLGFQDALALSSSSSVAAYAAARAKAGRVPEMLAIALYEVFADHSDEMVAVRNAVYRMWRRSGVERRRTMTFLACQDVRAWRFGGSFLKAITHACADMLQQGIESGHWGQRAKVSRELVSRARWLLSGALRLSDAVPFAPPDGGRGVSSAYDGALKASCGRAEVLAHPAAHKVSSATFCGAAAALEKACYRLMQQQADDGSWEGEVVWNAMLPAQYVIMCHITGTPIDAQRRTRLLRQFATTQLADGSWGMHELSPPYLFVTALVYVAARLLGVAADDALLTGARDFIAAEGGVVAIPSWGKFWLALVGLYPWQGVQPVIPEVWLAPKWLPVHPSNYYCHTRLIYLAMACLYGTTFGLRDSTLTQALRAELYPRGYDNVNVKQARNTVRQEELYAPPSRVLRAGYALLRQVDNTTSPVARERLRRTLRERIRFELKSSDYTCISPVSGMLNILALWQSDHDDVDANKALARFEGWIWQDDEDGLRVAGARSASWDSAFAVQALAAAAPHFDVTASLERGAAFLVSQQIRGATGDYAGNDRIDPNGGYCFAGVWHGWPVSDCTAEAMCALLDNPLHHDDQVAMTRAAQFVLRCQNADGGFGSYEAKRTRVPLEWLNPSEMYGNCVTEHSFVECTASCVAALATFREHYPKCLHRQINRAIAEATHALLCKQRADGSFEGVWGVAFVYGTMFAVRGLLAAGLPVYHPAIVKARRFVLSRQNDDGGWGESHAACLDDRQQAHPSQVIQSSWAMMTLLSADAPEWAALARGAAFLAQRQRADGSWPKEEPSGVFFNTALLHYELYRSYFPLWALALFESRRARRALAEEVRRGESVTLAPAQVRHGDNTGTL